MELVKDLLYKQKNNLKQSIEMHLQIDPSVISNNVSFVLRLKLRKTKFYDSDDLENAFERVVLKLFNVYNPDLVYKGTNELNIVFLATNKTHIFRGKKDKIKSVLPSFCSVVFNQELRQNDLDKHVLTFECESLNQYSDNKQLLEYIKSRKHDILMNSLKSHVRLYYTYDDYCDSNENQLKELLRKKNVHTADIPSKTLYGYIMYKESIRNEKDTFKNIILSKNADEIDFDSLLN